MNIFFDVDYTILGLDNSLRPDTKEIFQRLVDEGHLVYIWSGQGERWEVVRKFGLEPLVSGVYEKPLSDFFNRLGGLGVPVVPDFVIDDYPEVPSEAFEAAELYAKSHPFRGRPSGRPWRNTA